MRNCTRGTRLARPSPDSATTDSATTSHGSIHHRIMGIVSAKRLRRPRGGDRSFGAEGFHRGRGMDAIDRYIEALSDPVVRSYWHRIHHIDEPGPGPDDGARVSEEQVHGRGAGISASPCRRVTGSW